MGRGDFQGLAPRWGGCEVERRRKLMQVRNNRPEANRPAAPRVAMLLCHNTFHILQLLALRARQLGAAGIPSAAATGATWERPPPPTPRATPPAPPAPSPRSGTSAGIRHRVGDSAPDCSAPPGPCPNRRAGPRSPLPAP